MLFINRVELPNSRDHLAVIRQRGLIDFLLVFYHPCRSALK